MKKDVYQLQPLSTLQLARLLSGVWCVEENAANEFQQLVSKYFDGVTDTLLGSAPSQSGKPYAIDAEGNVTYWYDWDATGLFSGMLNTANIKPNSVVVMPIYGAMIKDDFCGALGTESIGNILQQLDTEPNVTGFVLEIDSPGGSVDGLDNFANLIYNLEKPTAAYVNGLMASAALYSGVAANRVIASNATALVGSIGTMMRYTDSRGWQEKQGVKSVTVYAPQSTQKNEEFNALEAGNTDLIKNQVLKPYAQQFIDFVKMARPQTANQPVFTGKTFMAQDAIVVGLVDEIGTLQDAIDFVRGAVSTFISNQSNSNMKIKNSVIEGWSWVSDLFGIGASADSNAETEITSEMLASANKKGEELEAQLNAALESKTALEAELKTAKDTIASKDATIVSLGEKFATAQAVIEGAPTSAAGNPTGSGAEATDNPFAQFASEINQ